MEPDELLPGDAARRWRRPPFLWVGETRVSLTRQTKTELHRRFWAGDGPPLLLLPVADEPLYDTNGYRARFEDPVRMLAAELDRAQPLVDWPTDGIPTVRPNLGVIFVPAMVGLGYEIRDGQMPWPGRPLERERIRRPAEADRARILELALEFYRTARPEEVAAYAPDTQGVFDIAVMLFGQELFFALKCDTEWVHELLDICLAWYVRATETVKAAMGEDTREMIHGHGTPQGVFFPLGGARASEDSATMLSPRMLDRFVLPYVERSLAPFGGGFVHFCGRHEYFFEALCRMPAVKAIDLGNSEMYDTRWLMKTAAATDTVLYTRIGAEPGEDWRAYLRRLGGLVRETGARLALRPLAFPSTASECAEALQLWRHHCRG